MPPSNTSSPLSSASLLDNDADPHDDDAGDNEAGPSRLSSPNEQRRRSRSATSSTVQLERPDDESDLSDLTDEEPGADPEEGQGEEEEGFLSDEEEAGERLPDNEDEDDQNMDLADEENQTGDPGVGKTAYDTDSDTNSLSPPPPSTGPKAQPLPEDEVEQSFPTDESDLESLTDSNDDQHQDEASLSKEAIEGPERPEENDEGEGEGDVTMRAGDLIEDVDVDEKVEGEEDADENVQVDEAEMADQVEEAEEALPEETAQEEEAEEAPPSPALSIQPFRPHSSHPPPPTSAAVKALFSLEIKFAAIRDKLYVERMEETAAEEEMLLNAIGYLFKNLKARRERLHEVASRRHKQVLEEILKVKDENKEAVWTWWTDERDREQWEEFEQTWSKRRRLIREKSELDHVSNKRIKPIPKSWADMPKPLDWAAGAIPAPMSAIDAANDLAQMDPRRSHASRNPSPTMYATPQSHSTPSSYGYYPETYQHPQYAQRVPPPAPHHQIHRLNQVPPGPGSGSSSNTQGTGYGTVFTEPRREGRTVPTSSALFDNGRDRRSNEGVTIHQQPSQPVSAPGLGAELWGKDRMNGQGQNNGLGHSLIAGAGPNGRGIGISNPNANGNGNGNGNGEREKTNGEGHGNGNGNGNGSGNGNHNDQTPPEEKPRYPSLTGFLSSNTTSQPTTQTQQGQGGKVGSPPKSSLGITGIPSGMPFI